MKTSYLSNPNNPTLYTGDLCAVCGVRPVEMKKRRACHPCYRVAKATGTLKQVPYIEPPEERMNTYKVGLTLRFGEDFLKDLSDLDTRHFWNLTEMGKKYGVTTEYIRQIHKKINGRGFREIKNKKTRERGVDIACKYDPRHKAAEYKPNSPAQISAMKAKLFYEICIKKGFEVDVLRNQSANLRVNGHCISVHTAQTAKTIPGAKTPKYHYSFKKNQIALADYYACWHERMSCFFIIPNRWKGPGKREQSIYINEIKSDFHTAKNKYYEYKDAWHLLERIDP